MLDFKNSNVQFLPDRLGKMKHLRYLGLDSCSELEELPDSISELQNLQFLDLTACGALKELPKNMGKNLVSLRHFAITAYVKNLSSINVGCFKFYGYAFVLI